MGMAPAKTNPPARTELTALGEPVPNQPMPPVAALTAGLKKSGTRLLDIVLPPRCLKCGATVDAVGALCATCWPAVAFLAPPHCAACGLPFEFDLGPDALCGACARERPVFDRARAAFRYDEGSKDLILRFKHADRTDSAPAFARWIVRAGDALVAETDLVTGVPLHWVRLFTRRYNQAALLASALAQLAGKPAVNDLLVRRKRTPSQGGLGANARRRNVAGAFIVHPRHRALLADKRVLLVDDVLTTGATVSACASVMLRAGARAVDVLTLARVVRLSV
jgi:ComF family protein